MFFWLLETAIVNSYILYKLNLPQEQQKTARQRKFRRELVRKLVGDIRFVPKRKRPSVEDGNRLDGKLHLIYPLEGPTKVKDCIVCSDRSADGQRKRSKFFCKTCRNNPGIHPGLCFEKFHTLLNYK